VTCDVGYFCANFIFLGLSVLDLGPTYATDRQTDRQADVRQTYVCLTDVRRASSLNAPTLVAGHNKNTVQTC